MWGGHPFPLYWEHAECRDRAEWKVQRVKERAQECTALPILSGSARSAPAGVKWVGGRPATLHVLQPEMVSPFSGFDLDF